MYEQAPLLALYQLAGRYYAASSNANMAFVLDDPATWNVLKSVIDTASSQVGSSNPHPKFITIDGTIKQKRRAKKAENFCNGWAEEVDLYAITYRILIDALVFDIAGVLMYEDVGKICLERTFGSEWSFDPIESARGNPQTLYRTVPVPKDRLIAKLDSEAKDYDKKRQAIEDAPEIGPGLAITHSGWHLPSGPEAEDGRYILAVEGTDGTIEDEQYDAPTLPVIFLKWQDSLAGSYGRSMAADLEPVQSTLNRRLRRLDTSDRLVSVPRLAVQRGSKILKSQLTNLPGSQIEYTTQAPTLLQWAAATSDQYQFIENLVQKEYDLAGVSRNAAQGQKEAGTESAVAIREALDVQAARMRPKSKIWENFHLRIFKKLIELLATMQKRFAAEAANAVDDSKGNKGKKRKKAEKKKAFSYRVRYPGKKNVHLVDWKEVKYDEDEMGLSIQPVSALPLTAQGRLDYALDMLKAGLWTQARVAEVMEDLDIDSASKDLAVQRLIEDDFEAMLEDGETRYPYDWLPFDTIISTAATYFASAVLNKVSPKRMDIANRYIKEAKALQVKAQPPAPATPAIPPVAAQPVQTAA
jgi:hypothetical protein